VVCPEAKVTCKKGAVGGKLPLELPGHDEVDDLGDKAQIGTVGQRSERSLE
jgi:hypothetical protein